MHIKRIIKKTTIPLLLGLALIPATIAKAEIQTDTIDEMWGKPTLVYGAGLNNSEVNQTNQSFKIKNIDNVNRQVNSGADFATYLGQQNVQDNVLFSSVLVQKQAKGKGVVVDIKTPENITLVTETQYANAAITAGASDVKIDVASVKKVTGESALVGVYKALSANGVKVDEGRAQAATQELQTVNEIANEQKDNKKFDPQALDLAIAQTKKDLADYKKQNGEVAKIDDVQKIVEKALSDNNLNGILETEQIQSLVSFAESYQKTSAIDSKEVANQLEQYSKYAYSKLSNEFKDKLNNTDVGSFKEKATSFIENLWKSIINFFNPNN